MSHYEFNFIKDDLEPSRGQLDKIRRVINFITVLVSGNTSI